VTADDQSIGLLIGGLIGLLCLSAFFAGSETALMSVNRYRLRHAARAGRRGARYAERLLARPDRLIGLILLGNTLANVAISTIAAVLVVRIGGERAALFAAPVVGLIVLVFAEVAPKTLAALKPEQVALPAAFVYVPLLWLCYPFVWMVNGIANGLLRLMRLHSDAEGGLDALSREELRTVLAEASGMIPKRHQQMLLGILDLERVTVDDIMVPRHAIVGIDLADDWSVIESQLDSMQHTRVPVYEGNIERMFGMLHLRKLVRIAARGELDKQALRDAAGEVYYVPEGTPLHKQLINFQTNRERIGLVVDEYGDILGLVTLEDILEEIVGEFTTDPAMLHQYVTPEPGGTYVINCGVNVRALNRTMRWKLPTDGPKTLNGLILEYLETIPRPGTTLAIAGHAIEILQVSDNAVKTARLRPPSAAPVRESAALRAS
jgi:Mg2+/Co2+ transporter CorB